MTATADGYRNFEANVEVEGQQARIKLVIELVIERAEQTESARRGRDEASSGEQTDETSMAEVGERTRAEGMSGRRKVSLAILGASVGLAGVGTALGLSARSRWDEASACESAPPCRQADADLADSAKTRGNIATGAFAIAGVGAAVAVWFYLSGDSSDKQLAISPRSITFITRF